MGLKDHAAHLKSDEGSQKMNKAIVYVAAAVILGFGIMMLPLALETGPPTYQPDVRPHFTKAPLSEDANAQIVGDDLRQLYGLGEPSNLIPFSLIISAGLIAALSVYVILKRRMT